MWHNFSLVCITEHGDGMFDCSDCYIRTLELNYEHLLYTYKLLLNFPITSLGII